MHLPGGNNKILLSLRDVLYIFICVCVNLREFRTYIPHITLNSDVICIAGLISNYIFLYFFV